MSSLFLSACGLYECIDMKFPRAIKPIGEVFSIHLAFEGQQSTMQIRCEEYYDAMCAERGNFLSVREVGREKDYQQSAFHLSSQRLGEVEVPVPPCTDLVRGKPTPLEHIVPKIRGEPFWLESSEGDVRTYAREGASVRVNLRLEVNGMPLNPARALPNKAMQLPRLPSRHQPRVASEAISASALAPIGGGPRS